MNKLIDKPHLIFVLAIPILLLIGLLSGDAALDIQVYDTYYVVTYLHVAILISIVFGIIGIGYWIMQKADRILSTWLIWVHIGLTFGGILIVWILTRFYRVEFMEYEFNNNLTQIIAMIILLMVVGQLLFPINILYGLIKKKNNPTA